MRMPPGPRRYAACYAATDQHAHGLGGGRHVSQHVAATAGAPQTGQITPKYHRGSDDRRHMRDHERDRYATLLDQDRRH